MARKRTGKGSLPRRQDGAKGSIMPGKGDRPERSPARSAPANAGTKDPSSNGDTSGRGLGVTRSSTRSGSGAASSSRSRQQVIPDAVANRMARRIAIATGIPTLMGMGVFIASYLVVSRGIFDIPPSATLLASGACFLLGLVGLSYGVLSCSWEDVPGTLLGREQIGVNISRVRDSIRAMRQGASGGTQG